MSTTWQAGKKFLLVFASWSIKRLSAARLVAGFNRIGLPPTIGARPRWVQNTTIDCLETLSPNPFGFLIRGYYVAAVCRFLCRLASPSPAREKASASKSMPIPSAPNRKTASRRSLRKLDQAFDFRRRQERRSAFSHCDSRRCRDQRNQRSALSM